MPTTVLRSAAKQETDCLIPGEFVRRRALHRLYERKAAVEELIHSLECYERINRQQPGECVPFTAQRKCS